MFVLMSAVHHEIVLLDCLHACRLLAYTLACQLVSSLLEVMNTLTNRSDECCEEV